MCLIFKASCKCGYWLLHSLKMQKENKIWICAKFDWSQISAQHCQELHLLWPVSVKTLEKTKPHWQTFAFCFSVLPPHYQWAKLLEQVLWSLEISKELCDIHLLGSKTFWRFTYLLKHKTMIGNLHIWLLRVHACIYPHIHAEHTHASAR